MSYYIWDHNKCNNEVKKSSKKLRGRPRVAKPKNNVVKLRLDDDEYVRTVKAAKKHNLSTSDWLRRANSIALNKE